MSTNGRIPHMSGTAAAPTTGRQAGRLQFSEQLAAEDDEGSVEYKWRLTNISANRFEHLVTQMRFRVAEGCGQCIYELGVEDDGVAKGLPDADFEESLETVRRMTERLNLEMRVVHERVVATAHGAGVGERLRCAELVVTKRLPELQDLRIAVCGSTGSGKSTLVGVLVGGALDDGGGSVRQGVFNHKHEFDTGRTSSVVHRVLGFDETGRITNYDDAADDATAGNSRSQQQQQPHQDVATGYASLSQAMDSTRTIAERSLKLVTLMDLAGDSRYSKTTIFGMTSRLPGYACVCIAGDSTCAEEEITTYVHLCKALHIPLFIVVSKVDVLNEIELDDYLSEASAALQSHGGLRSTQVASLDDARAAVDCVAVAVQATVPIFLVSSVDGTGVRELKLFLHHLPHSQPAQPTSSSGPCEVLLDSTFTVQEVGPVTSGFVSKGYVSVGLKVMLGPDRRGMFHERTVQSIHVKGSHVTRVNAGCEATFCIGSIPSSVDISRKGKVLVSPDAIPNVGREFEMTVQVLTKDEMMVSQQEPIVHCRNIRQAAKIISMSPEPLRWNETGRMRCRFLYNPEVIDENSVVVLRWGRHAKLIGTVSTVSPVTPSFSPQMRAELAPSPPPQEVPTATNSPGDIEDSGDDKLLSSPVNSTSSSHTSGGSSGR